MKRITATLFAILMSMATYAQKDVTKFLGIPIDGAMSTMITKLKTKGFKTTASENQLEGTFNGGEVYVMPVENKGKVWRILVCDKSYTDETNIRIRFNNLVRQFSKNAKYSSYKKDQYIGEDEDILYEMSVHKKRYEGIFFQNPSDPMAVQNYAQQCLLSKYTQDQIQQPTTEQKEDMNNIIDEAIDDFMGKRTVWFMISKDYGKYYIIMFYENGYNQDDGEDL